MGESPSVEESSGFLKQIQVILVDVSEACPTHVHGTGRVNYVLAVSRYIGPKSTATKCGNPCRECLEASSFLWNFVGPSRSTSHTKGVDC